MTRFNRELDCLATAETPARPIWAVRPVRVGHVPRRNERAAGSLPARLGFTAEPDILVLLPDPSGLAGAVLGLGEARDPFGFGGLAAALPKGTVLAARSGRFRPGRGHARLLPRRLSARRGTPGRGRGRRSPRGAGGNRGGAAHRPRRLDGARPDQRPGQSPRPGGTRARRRPRSGARCGAETSLVAGEALAREYPTIAAVGAGSERAPQVAILRWRGSEAHADAPLVSLCGKGVCFDSGGYDLKPSSGMLRMKKDMGGAAIALGIARLVMEADLPVRLALRLGCVENSVSGRAMRPLDVVRTRRGLAVEIGNTDAEGRLVLCDLLAEASDEQPALLLDLATLTGAARVALGPDLPALFCNDEAWAAALLVAGETEADPLWRLPLWSGYDKWLASPMADLNNVASQADGGRGGRGLVPATLPRPGTPWAHLDVYAWNDQTRPGRPEGGEAQAMRAVVASIAGRFTGTDQDRNMRFT